jgi:hypothetical protein
MGDNSFLRDFSVRMLSSSNVVVDDTTRVVAADHKELVSSGEKSIGFLI